MKEATTYQYIFCLFLYLFIMISPWLFKKLEKSYLLVFGLCLIYCLFNFSNSDYFSYMRELPKMDENFRDFLYYYIAILSGRNYFFFRLLIWGSAIILFYCILKRLNIDLITSSLIFIWFFLPTFAYARVSLAMASYFLGLSYLLEKDRIYKNIFIGLFFIIFSFFAHRSFLPVIVMTPLALIKLNKKYIICLLFLSPLFIIILRSLMSLIIQGTFLEGSEFESFSNSAKMYANIGDTNKNWKYVLVTGLKNYGFYVPLIYILWRFIFSNKKINIPIAIDGFLTISVILMYVAFLFFVTKDFGASDVIGYRYLYMAGIPIVIILSYLIQESYISYFRAFLLTSCVMISNIAFILGKLLFRT